MRGPLVVFSLQSGRAFGERVARLLNVPLAAHEERDFEWGQHKSRPLESVRGADVYVVQSLHGEVGQTVNDKLCRLLFFLGALRDAGASQITAVVPYLCYSRKERQTKHRDPVITRYVAACFEAVGVDRVVTLEVHDLAALQNAFRCRTEHLGARYLFVDAIAGELRGQDPVVVSPDPGGLKRANRYREALATRLGRDVPTGVVDKRRSDDVVSGHLAVGDFQGRVAVVVDDMICGGTTLALAAAACVRKGATRVIAVAPHGTFVEGAAAALREASLQRVFVLDHIPPATLDQTLLASKVTVLDSTPLFAEAIRRLHEDRPLDELLDP